MKYKLNVNFFILSYWLTSASSNHYDGRKRVCLGNRMRKIKFYGGDSSHEPEESSRSSLWYISAILWPKYWTVHKVLRRALPCHPAVLNRSFVFTLLLMQPEYSGFFFLFLVLKTNIETRSSLSGFLLQRRIRIYLYIYLVTAVS